MKRFTALLLAVLMMFALAACSNQEISEGVKDSGEVKSIAGVYRMISFEENGEEEEIEDIKYMFYPDGTVSGSEPGMQELSWTQEGDVISIKLGENEIGCSVDGDTLTLTYEDEHESTKMILTKISEVEMDPIVGTYKITHYEKYEEESTDEFSDMELIVYANGNCEYQGNDVVKHFRWMREGDQLTFEYGGDVTEVKTLDMTVDGDKINYDRYGEKVTFTKQK